jgi:hypothetical protein
VYRASISSSSCRRVIAGCGEGEKRIATEHEYWAGRRDDEPAGSLKLWSATQTWLEVDRYRLIHPAVRFSFRDSFWGGSNKDNEYFHSDIGHLYKKGDKFTPQIRNQPKT